MEKFGVALPSLAVQGLGNTIKNEVAHASERKRPERMRPMNTARGRFLVLDCGWATMTKAIFVISERFRGHPAHRSGKEEISFLGQACLVQRRVGALHVHTPVAVEIRAQQQLVPRIAAFRLLTVEAGGVLCVAEFNWDIRARNEQPASRRNP